MAKNKTNWLIRLRSFRELSYLKVFVILFFYVLIFDIILSMVFTSQSSFWGVMVFMFYFQSLVFISLVFVMAFLGGFFLTQDFLMYMSLLLLLACIFFILAIFLNMGFGVEPGITLDILLDFNKPDLPEPK